MAKKELPPPRGRPKLPEDQVRSEFIKMRATKSEKAAWDERGGEVWLRKELKRKPRV